MGLTLISSSALAQRDHEDKQSARRGPPAEAIEACSNLSEGDTCQFTGRRGDVSGSCSLPPSDDSVLACKPKNHKQKS